MGRRVVCEALCILAIAALAGCGGETQTLGAAWTGTVDTVDGVMVVTNPAQPILTGADAWRLEETLSIGVLEGDPAYQFGGIAAIEVDEAGFIYVLDPRVQRVAVFDSAGVFGREFGREGEGPGEFRYPSRLLWEGDTLVVWDSRLRRLSYFDRDGNLLRDARVDLPVYSRFVPRIDGWAWVQLGPTYWWPMRPGIDGVGHIVAVSINSPDDVRADTLLSWEDVSTIPVRFDQGLTVIPRRYAPRLRWTADRDGRLYAARGDTYEIEVHSPAGEHMATITREYQRHPPSAAELDSARAWIEEAAEDYGQHADRVRNASEIAELKRATGEVVVSDDGYLWVLAVTEDDLAQQTWDIFDPGWRYLTSVTLPRGLTVHRITSGALYGEIEDEFEVPYVKRYSIRRSGARLNGEADGAA